MTRRRVSTRGAERDGSVVATPTARRRAVRRLTGAVLACGLGVGLTPAVAGASASASAAVDGVVRVNQQGYLAGERKTATLMSSHALSGQGFVVEDRSGRVWLRGTVPASEGAWNSRYRAVQRLDLTALRSPGTYRVVVRGAGVTSGWFPVTRSDDVFRELVTKGVAFDRLQRDGDDLARTVLPRSASHLTDRSAQVYAWPDMEDDSDVITDHDLTPSGGTVDVEGGWFDAGDYLKFTHSAAYADVVLYTSSELLGSAAPAALRQEARYGLGWLSKMWDDRHGVLYLQVGIGSGNEDGTFYGDHDLFRLPQADDADTSPLDRYVSHRPVFAANRAGQKISPNLVGRVSAAFALAAQADAQTDRPRALRELKKAQDLYALAAVDDPPTPLVTALPNAFYPEDTWRDDMQLGAAQIAVAAQRLGKSGGAYVADAARFAKERIAAPGDDTLNLYDVGALADVALADALRTVPRRTVAVDRADLTADLRRQLRLGVRASHEDLFGAPVDIDQFDANSHAFGFITTAALYQRLTGDTRYAGFASDVRTWLMGGDPWGVTAMVGVGTRFPQCIQHQVANLAGSLTGGRDVAVGAVVNGPNGADNFDGGLGGFQDGMRRCTSASDHLDRFDGKGSRFVDDVRSWQTDEPALDMTGAAILAGASSLAAAPRTVPWWVRPWFRPGAALGS